MSQHAMDCPAELTLPSPPVGDGCRLRYSLISRARQDIRAGVYDDDDHIDHLLDQYLDRIVEDVIAD